MDTHVYITGVGVLTPIGLSVQQFWTNALAGCAAVAPVPAAWHSYFAPASTLWAPLGAVDYTALGFSRIEQMQLDRTEMLAAAASGQALTHAGFAVRCIDEKKGLHAIDGIDSERAGVYLGTGSGGVTSLIGATVNHTMSPVLPVIKEAGERTGLAPVSVPARYNPFVVPMMMPNGPAAFCGIRFGLSGPNTAFCCACAAGTVAIGHAYRDITAGRVDLALAGGVEFLGDEYGGIFRGFDIARTLVRDCADRAVANRPFDAKRSGFLFAEGAAAVLVLESGEQVRARNAQPIARICGYGETFDAYSLMSMEPSGKSIRRMIAQALDDAKTPAAEIDYVNAHGTGTQTNDELESAIIESAFPHNPIVNSTKSLVGHSIGAAGALEAAVTALSLRDQTTHPSLNITVPVRELNFVKQAGPQVLSKAFSHSFAFGGHNAGLVFERVIPNVNH